MKRTKQFILLTCFMVYLSFASAQPEFTAEVSQLFPTFKFKDSEGIKHNDDYQSLITGAYGIGLRYILESGIFFRAGIGIRNAGANLVYDQVNYSWKLQYGDFKLGLGYRTKFKTVKPYFVASGYYATLLRGTQTLHNQTLNVVKSGILKNQDLGVQFTPGIDIRFSEYFSSYLEFNYLMGLSNIELGSAQKATNSALGFNIGIAVLLLAK